MTVIYRSPLAIVFQGRSEDVLPTLAKASVDCIVTDPPYGQAWKGTGRQTERAAFPQMEGDDGTADIGGTIGLALKALRPGRHLYVFGPEVLAGLPVTTAGLIWDKAILSPGAKACWGTTHEPITFGVYTPSQANRDRGDGRLAVRLRRGSVLRVPRLHSRQCARHPTEKPVRLVRQLVEASSCIGEVILDPYAGSGATAVASILTGRRAIAIEVDPGYCQTIVNRVKEAEGLAQEIERL
jgi:site-specific DNA-methyltransferase (adenine-specific)